MKLKKPDKKTRNVKNNTKSKNTFYEEKEMQHIMIKFYLNQKKNNKILAQKRSCMEIVFKPFKFSLFISISV